MFRRSDDVMLELPGLAPEGAAADRGPGLSVERDPHTDPTGFGPMDWRAVSDRSLQSLRCVLARRVATLVQLARLGSSSVIGCLFRPRTVLKKACAGRVRQCRAGRFCHDELEVRLESAASVEHSSPLSR